jgi:predicted phage tail protein
MSAVALREVRLYGALGREFGRVFRLAVATPAEAVRALRAVLPGFERAFLGRDGRQAYHVFVGRRDARRDIGKGQLQEPIGAAEPIRFVPVIAGAKRGGVLQTIIGYVLMVAGAVAVVYTGSDFGLVTLGFSLMVGGVIQMLSPQRQGKAAASNLPSYAFDGPINNTQQGGPVPCCYGRAMVGSVVVSQGISTEYQVVTVGPVFPDLTGKLPPYEPPDPYEDRGAP